MLPVRYLLVVGTFSLSILLYVDRICISTAQKEICSELRLDNIQFGWVLSIFSLGYALFQSPGGWLADRLGPRRVLAAIVVIWSIFTGLTAAATNFVALLVVRFLFGVGEAGAFPGVARAAYSWIPMQERGIVQGINFSGSRIGGAASLMLMPWMIEQLGWKFSFVVLMLVGWIWAAVWYWWFRDEPSEHRSIATSELEHILSTRQVDSSPALDARQNVQITWRSLLKSNNLWLISMQYFCSNFTFFFCLAWLFPHMKERFQLSGYEAGFYSATPLLFGAIGNWTAGWCVDYIYQRGHWVLSRRAPAMVGFACSAVGLIASTQVETPWAAVAWLSLAVLGGDMTLASSWSCCMDIGKNHSGVVSGTMNMAGNFGSFLTALAFPYMLKLTGSHQPYFWIAAVLNLLAIGLWLRIDPRIHLERDS